MTSRSASALLLSALLGGCTAGDSDGDDVGQTPRIGAAGAGPFAGAAGVAGDGATGDRMTSDGNTAKGGSASGGSAGASGRAGTPDGEGAGGASSGGNAGTTSGAQGGAPGAGDGGASGAAVGGGPGSAGTSDAPTWPGGDFRGAADAAANALQGFYDPSKGLFTTTGWWNSANGLTALIDYSARTGSSSYVGDLAQTFSKNDASNFLNDYYDDEGWWALAWVDAYDLTGNGQFLTAATTIFDDMKQGWDATCGGGIWWSKDRTYKNAIANELFLLLAARLHARTPGDAGAESYLEWATNTWAWFDGSGLINAGHLVNDGLDASCKNNGGPTWTYNQGVLIGALVELASGVGESPLLSRAESIAAAARTSLVDDVGVLRDPCEPSCGGDGPQFKGIFMRHLGTLAAATGSTADNAFLATNADWLWNAARGPQNRVGLSWSRGFDGADAARQASALDALNAAIRLSAPLPNLALFKPASANGTCTSDGSQTPDKAFDGSTTTKWCAGTSTGAYRLSVDLGKSTQVGRVVVRHAGAGGEKPGWNTKDFALSVSTDGSTWRPVSTTTGNTRSVTIHSFAPSLARYVRLDISNPQTDSQSPAARISELEVYGR